MSPDDVPVSHYEKVFGLARQGDFDAAVALAQQDYDACMAFFGNRNSDTASAANNLGCAFQMKGDLMAAMDYYEKAQEVIKTWMILKSRERRGFWDSATWASVFALWVMAYGLHPSFVRLRTWFQEHQASTQC